MTPEEMERNIQDLQAAPGLEFPTQFLNAKTYQEPVDKVPLVPLEEDVRRAFSFQNEIIDKLPLTDRGCLHKVYDINHDWARYVLRGAKSWHNGMAGSVVINTYRRLTPPKYQTAEHMNVVYTLFAVVEFVTTMTIMLDDQYDMTLKRHQEPTWYLAHPVSLTSDALILPAMAQRILLKLFPRNHPCFTEILEESLTYFQTCTTYFSYDATYWNRIGRNRYKEMLEHRTRELESLSSEEYLPLKPLITKSPIPFESFGVEAYCQHQDIRAVQFLQYCVNVGRLAACYTSVDVMTTNDVVKESSEFMAAFDDYQEYNSSGNSRYEDNTGGAPEIFLSILMDSLRDPEFPSEKREKIMKVLERNFGTQSIAGAKVVVELYEEMGIPQKVRQYLYGIIDDLDQASAQAMKINFPMAIVFDMIVYMCREEGTLNQDTIKGVHALTSGQGYPSKEGAYSESAKFLRRLVDYYRPS
ncbi:hypothetical protein FE257_003033 [Aspergillus nanangensis]|uniref:Uncharacterized protein n=1 Tax=Aspergillus nanangensis TaxID=2582783 RepID=A0AAD4CC06_ASPNN|nr:hypothetical protein FE257_003033 [Aspergillus nanangensis]